MIKRTMAILLAFLTLCGCQGFPFSNLKADAQRKLNEALQASHLILTGGSSLTPLYQTPATPKI